MNQYRVSDAAKSDLDEIWFYIAQDNLDAADKFMRAIVSRFPTSLRCRRWDASVLNCRLACAALWSVTMSSSIACLTAVLKLCGCWMV